MSDLIEQMIDSMPDLCIQLATLSTHLKKKSTHRAEVIPLVLHPHDNADSLSIVYNGLYSIVVRTESWAGKTKAVHVLPDSIVDTDKPEFAFLKPKNGERFTVVRPCKLRGVQSYGCLVECPPHLEIGDDAAEFYGIEHYDPEEKLITGGDCVKAPCEVSKYDIDSFMKYSSLLEGEDVIAERKIHGANMRVLNKDGEIFVGSRNQWKAYDPSSQFWKSYESDPGIKEFVVNNPNWILYGESYGNVKGFKYECKQGHVKFAAFDIFDLSKQCFLDIDHRNYFLDLWKVPRVEEVYRGPYDKDKLMSLATKQSEWGFFHEGIVIRPSKEKWDRKLGRVIMKIISPEFKG